MCEKKTISIIRFIGCSFEVRSMGCYWVESWSKVKPGNMCRSSLKLAMKFYWDNNKQRRIVRREGMIVMELDLGNFSIKGSSFSGFGGKVSSARRSSG